MEDALSPQAVAKVIGCSVAALRAWKRSGKGPRYYKAGKLLRYRREDVEGWIEQNLSAESDEKGQL